MGVGSPVIKIPRKSPRDATLSSPKKPSTCHNHRVNSRFGTSFQNNGNKLGASPEGLGLFDAVPYHVLGPAPHEGAEHQNYRHDVASLCHLRGLMTIEERNKRGRIRAQNK